VVATPYSFDSLAVEEDGRIAIGAGLPLHVG
jgi:hypothetical protein